MKKNWRITLLEYQRGRGRNYMSPLRTSHGKSKMTDHVFQIDKTELDLYVVSEENPSDVLEKPVIYAVTDVRSGKVIAVKADIKNKSFGEFRDLFMTILEPHSTQAAIRYVRGLKYESIALEAACKELGLQVTYVKEARRSMKELAQACHHSIGQRLVSNEGYTNRTSLTLTDVADILTEAANHYNEKPKAGRIKQQA